MALRINLKDDSASGQINRWAAQLERQQKAHEKQLAQLNQYVTKLHELNPDLQRPDLK